MKKRVLIGLLAAGMTLSLAACGSAPSAGTQETQTTPQGSAASDTQSAQPAAGGRTLVVYYSASGYTEAVAKTIAETTGGDLFEVVPTQPYTADDLNWTDSDSRVSREHEDESLRDIPLTSTAVENWEEYDTVYIGYPIWWGIAAWPMNGFVSANDFSSKTVIPFCTSSSSGIGQSGELLAQLAGTGDWQSGQRFRSSVDPSDVADWVNGVK